MLEKVMDYTPIGYCLIPLNRKDWLWRINVLLPDIIDSVYESRKPVFGEDTYYGICMKSADITHLPCTHILLLQQYMYSPSKNDVTYNFLPIKSLHLFIPFYLWSVPWFDKTITRYMSGFFPPVIDSLARSQNATYLFIF